MKEFWESKFSEDKTSWGFIPSDSAITASEFFKLNGISDILIPGIGYGRNAIVFIEKGIQVTGIEIAKSAIDLAKENNLNIPIFLGSVIDMPFDDRLYNGIYCYALLHLLNKYERKKFITACYNQLKPGGYMIFVIVSQHTNIYGTGKLLSKNRYKITNGLNVFFYNHESVKNEFSSFGMVDYFEMDEPVKHMKNEPPLKFFYVVCKHN